MRLYRIVVVAILIVVMSDTAVLGQIAQASGAQPYSFSLSIRAPLNTIELGKEAMVDVTITNTSSSDLFFVAADLAFDVRDLAGRPAPHVRRKSGSRPPGGTFVSIPIKPGQSIDRSIDLNKRFVINTPGRYTIQAWREDYAPGGNEIRGRVKSNTIAIDFVE